MKVKKIMVRYLVINAPSTYNIILGWPATNTLGAIMSTTYLKVKFPLDDESAEIISVNQEIKCKCYEDSLKARRGISDQWNTTESTLWNWTHREISWTNDWLKWKVKGSRDRWKVKIGMALPPQIEADLLEVLKRSSSTFSWRKWQVVVSQPYQGNSIIDLVG